MIVLTYIELKIGTNYFFFFSRIFAVHNSGSKLCNTVDSFETMFYLADIDKLQTL